jgi:cytoskeletal protein RodZ
MATPSFGEKLKQERERRNTSIEEIAEKTRIALRFLQALEKDEFDELPGRAFGKLYIRAYAEILDFDPEPLIVQYDSEQAEAGGTPVEAPPPAPVKLRRVEAEIARWREARQAGQPPSTDPTQAESPTPDTVPAAEGDASPDSVEPLAAERETRHEDVDRSEPLPALDRQAQAGGARYDEAAALASILGTGEPTPTASRRRRVILAWIVGVALLAVLGWIVVSSLGPDDEGSQTSFPVETTESRIDETPVEETTSEAEQESAARTNAPAVEVITESPPESVPVAAPEESVITVSEFGVGRRIVNRRLEDSGRSFEEGSVVFFQTRVVGGERGEQVRHVWLRDGRAVQTVDLQLGGSHWRTHSRKTLWGAGPWAVEARDRTGRVLARAEFVCVPAG